MEKYADAGKTLDVQEIDQFQKDIGLDLPREFVEFYLENNGGYPPYKYINTEEQVFAIDMFLPIKYGSVTIDRLIQDYRNREIEIGERVPFAADPADNIYMLSLAPADYGSIYLFGHAYDSREQESYTFVCSSFTSFLESFTNEYAGGDRDLS